LNPSANQGGTAIVNDSSVVRRLTPVECERLQGFPDDWTSGQADSNRYKQMGNAVAVPVVEWIVGRLVAQLDE
jgi:DNA (cytosine-5)-methyltransferase 1